MFLVVLILCIFFILTTIVGFSLFGMMCDETLGSRKKFHLFDTTEDNDHFKEYRIKTTPYMEEHNKMKSRVLLLYRGRFNLDEELKRMKFFIKFGTHLDYVEYIFLVTEEEIKDIDTETLFNQTQQTCKLVILPKDHNGDFGAWSYGLSKYPNYDTDYTHLCCVNASVLGPLIIPSINYKKFDWLESFINLLTKETVLVGPMIHKSGNWGFHVQSYMFVVPTNIVKKYLEKTVFQFHKMKSVSHEKIIQNGELLMSKILLKNNLNITSIIKAVRNIDIRKIIETKDNTLFGASRIWWGHSEKDQQEWLFPYEHIFVKGNRKRLKLLENRLLVDLQ
jgi:hypothetical protein